MLTAEYVHSAVSVKIENIAVAAMWNNRLISVNPKILLVGFKLPYFA